MSTAVNATCAKRSQVRWIIVALLFWVSMSNILDRSVFGNLAPEMPRYLHMASAISSTEIELYRSEHKQAAPADDSEIRDLVARDKWSEWYWDINTIFSAAYALSMLLMGRLMDVWGLRKGFAFAITLWMAAEMLHAFAPEIGGLFGTVLAGFLICRVLLGLGEGAVSPACNKAIAEWFPRQERALATGVASGASAIGGVLAPWLLPMLLALFSGITIAGVVVGWRGLFLLTGSVDILLVLVWLWFYREPAQHARVNSAELAYIQSDAATDQRIRIPWRHLVPHRQTWAFIAAKALTDGFWWFYLFGSPDFFARKFNLGPADRRYLLVMVYLVSAMGAVAGGWLAGKFIQRGWSINRARKTTMLLCALCAAPVCCAGLTNHKLVAVALITLAASAHQAWGANVMCLPGDMFPKSTVGSLTGIAGVCSTGASMLLMYTIGQIIGKSGSYLPVFFLASVAYLAAWLIAHALAPRLEAAHVG